MVVSVKAQEKRVRESELKSCKKNKKNGEEMKEKEEEGRLYGAQKSDFSVLLEVPRLVLLFFSFMSKL